MQRRLCRRLAAAAGDGKAERRQGSEGFDRRDERPVDGKAQVTYNGHPLYRFSGDQKPGDTNGQGVSAFGGLWYAVSPTGDQVTTQAPGGGSGY